MSWRLLLISIMATIAYGAKAPGPTEFYIVSAFFSDFGALFYYRVIEVKPDGSDSLIRYTRIAPIDVYCGSRRMIVQAAAARVHNTSPSQLVKSNPCDVKPEAFQSLLRKYRQPAGVLESISFGIV